MGEEHQLERALELNPRDPVSLGIKAELLRIAGRYEEALEALDHALKVNPDDPVLLQTKGQILRLLGGNENYEQALWLLDRTLEMNPYDASALKYKGDLLRVQGRSEEALEVLDRVLELNSDDAWTLGTKGQILRELGNSDEAVEPLERAVMLDPNLAWAQAELGAALLMLGRYEEALEALDETLKLDPNNPFALTNKGDVLRVLERNEEALEVLTQALEMNSEQAAWILGSKGAVLAALERPAEALRTLNEALEQLPDDGWTLTAKAQVLCAIADYEGALSVLDRVMEVDSDNAPAHAYIGWAFENLRAEHVLQMTEYARKALQAYKRAADLEPENLWWRRGWADALYMLGDRQEAAEKHEEIIKEAKRRIKKVDASALSLLGWSYYRLEQWERAIRHYDKAISLDPNLVDTQFDLALALTCSAHRKSGLESYQRGVELTMTKEALTRRGLLHVARCDLEQAVYLYPKLATSRNVRKARKLLIEAYKEADNEAAQDLAERPQ